MSTLIAVNVALDAAAAGALVLLMGHAAGWGAGPARQAPPGVATAQRRSGAPPMRASSVTSVAAVSSASAT